MTNDSNNNGSRSMLMANALGSAAAGIVSRTLTHPLDTAKSRLQATGSLYTSSWNVLQRTWQQEGVRGLYRGYGAVIVGGTPGTILYLCGYELFKEKLGTLLGTGDGSSSFPVHFGSGLLAEAVACIVYVPVDVVKERLQVQHNGVGSTNYAGMWDALRKISKTEGLSGIYKGYGATLASFGPFSALYFVFYEEFKKEATVIGGVSSTTHLSLPWIIASSSGAGALASFLTSPLDMAKLRLQIQRGQQQSANPTLKSAIVYRGMVDCLRSAYTGGGIQGLFRGAGARVLHFVPATTVSMTTYESCRNLFREVLQAD